MASKVFYGETRYARVSPTPAEIAAVTREDLVAFHEQFYCPNGAILGVAGDVSARDVVQQLEQALAAWKPAPREAERPPTAFPPRESTRIYLVHRPGSTQTVLEFGNRAIARTDPDYVPLTVANYILGGGPTGRLNRNLREAKGFTYGAFSAMVAAKWPGTWRAGASVRTEVTEPAVAAFMQEFARLQREPVTAEELDRAKRAIIGSFALTLERPESILDRMLELVNVGLPLDYWDTFPKKVEAVTAADVQRVARQYLGEKRIQLIAVGERDRIEAGLQQHGPIEVVSAEGRPAGE